MAGVQIEIICQGCGEKFTYERARINGRKRKWCDACAGSERRRSFRESKQRRRKVTPQTLARYKRDGKVVNHWGSEITISCGECGEPVTYKYLGGSVRKHCDACRRKKDDAATKEWRDNNKEYITQWHRDQKLLLVGLDRQEYTELIAQGCKLCGSHEWGGRGPNIDHAHNLPGCEHDDNSYCVKCFRGILCGNCNQGLGFFNDDPERLAAAIKYLSEQGKA